MHRCRSSPRQYHSHLSHTAEQSGSRRADQSPQPATPRAQLGQTASPSSHPVEFHHLQNHNTPPRRSPPEPLLYPLPTVLARMEAQFLHAIMVLSPISPEFIRGHKSLARPFSHSSECKSNCPTFAVVWLSYFPYLSSASNTLDTLVTESSALFLFARKTNCSRTILRVFA
jgi:hypothetical protein